MHGQPHWWIFGYIDGKPVCDGGHQSEAKAYEKAFSINDWDSDFSIKMYRTSNMAVAKAAWKSEQAGLTGNMAMSLRPIRGIMPKDSNKKSRIDEIKEERGL